MAGNGLEQLDAERRAHPDHHLTAIVARGGWAHRPVAHALALGCLVHGLRPQHLLARENVADRHDLLAPRVTYAISCAGPKVVVGIVDGAEDTALTDHRGGLQIVAGNTQSHELQKIFRFLSVSALG